MIKLKSIKDFSAELQELYTFTDSQTEQFHINIHHYNEAFVFTSANYNVDIRVTEYTSSFQIHDKLYHLHGSLKSDDDMTSKFAQI